MYFLSFEISNDSDYTSSANYRSQIPAIFGEIFEIILEISKYFFFFFTISRGAPNDVVLNLVERHFLKILVNLLFSIHTANECHMFGVSEFENSGQRRCTAVSLGTTA
jgi:hypothetical protein